jgi:hypothetical protein
MMSGLKDADERSHGAVAVKNVGKKRELPTTLTGQNGIASTPLVQKKRVKRATEDSNITLSQSQLRVVNAILKRKSVFFTGAAGNNRIEYHTHSPPSPLMET